MPLSNRMCYIPLNHSDPLLSSTRCFLLTQLHIFTCLQWGGGGGATLTTLNYTLHDDGL